MRHHATPELPNDPHAPRGDWTTLRRLLAVNQSTLPSTQPKPRNSGKGKKRNTSIS